MAGPFPTDVFRLCSLSLSLLGLVGGVGFFGSGELGGGQLGSQEGDS